MKKLTIGFLVFAVVMSFSMAYAAPLQYINSRPVIIGNTSDLASACPGYANCELQSLLGPLGLNIVSDVSSAANQQVAGYWMLGGAYPTTNPTVAFEITSNSPSMQMGIFSDINGNPDTAGRTLVDIFNGPAAAGARATLAFDLVTGAMTIVKVTGASGSVNEGTYYGITPAGFGFYIQPTGSDSLTWYSLDQLNGGLAQMVAFREIAANRWTLAFEDTAIRNEAGGLNGDYDYNDFIFQIESIVPVPEPMTLILLGSGLLGLAAIRRKK